jgi:uncharacterized protein GlcG (DUF336 family)
MIRLLLVMVVALPLLLVGRAQAQTQSLTPQDVSGIIARVVQEALARKTPATVAVVDRMGAVLAVFQMNGAPTTVSVMHNANGPNAVQGTDGLNGVALPASEEAIAKAITGAYLSSSNGNAFSTRTASQIIQDHFNPGTAYAPAGPLYGVQFSSLPCSDLMVRVSGNDATTLTRGPHSTPVGLAGDPGGFPLYKNGELVGGVGVKTATLYGVDTTLQTMEYLPDELLAVAGAYGFQPPPGILAATITVGGLLLRYSDVGTGNLATNPANAPPLSPQSGQLVSVPGYYDMAGGLRAGSVYGTPASGLVQDSSGLISPTQQPYLLVGAAGQARYPAAAGYGPNALSQAETLAILRSAYAVGMQARAQIRNPPGQHAAVSVSVVDEYGDVLGIVTAPDTPVFGIDVALQKARTAAFLSNPAANQLLHANTALGKFADAANKDFGRTAFGGIAWSARATGNVARDTLPDGINGSPNGPLSLPFALSSPFSDGLQLDLVIHDLTAGVTRTLGFCTQLQAPPGSPYGVPVLLNGLQVFPGGFPIYRNATLIGGIGVSGDGVDQDDMIGFLGLYNAGQALKTGVGHAPQGIRASGFSALGVHPKYVNCPYAPFLNSAAENVCSGK